MTLRDILQSKGDQVWTISPDATLADVVESLVQHNCGSLVVCKSNDPCQMVGIVTERDILRACAAGQAPLEQARVSEVMTRRVVTGGCNDSVEDTMGLLTERRVRHLPIVEENRLVGIISIGDVVKAQYNALSAENHYLKNYIQG